LPVVHEHVLGNGLRVLVREVRTAPLAAVWCCYRVGSADEGPGLTGASHWVEHMNFKGTTHIPREKIKGLIEQYGGDWNAYTWLDQTCYTDTAAADALDHMLFIEAERMGGSLFEPEECESERTVIISELEGGENEPELLLDQEVTASAFRVHPYRHPTIGWVDDVRTMSRDDLYQHYRRFYVPNNATLVVVGDVDAAEVQRAVARRFEPIPPGEVHRPRRPVEPLQLGERRVTIARPGTAAYVRMAFRAPSVGHADFFPLLVLDAILSGPTGLNVWSGFQAPAPQRSARLYRALVDAGLASAVSGAVAPTAEPFLYGLSATATEGVALERLEQAMVQELDRVRTGGVTPGELARAKRQLRARLVFEDDSVTSLAHQLGFFQTIATWTMYTAIPDRIDAVTLEACGGVAASVLRPENRTVGWYAPSPDGDPLVQAPPSASRPARAPR
jgi:zinc protease